MKNRKKLENKLYENSDIIDARGIVDNQNDYTKMTSLMGGLLFSGVGYTVAATGSLIKDLALSLYAELPAIYHNIANGAGYNLPSQLSEIIFTSLSHANDIGGYGAAIGLIGGTVFFGKLRNSISSILRRWTN